MKLKHNPFIAHSYKEKNIERTKPKVFIDSFGNEYKTGVKLVKKKTKKYWKKKK